MLNMPDDIAKIYKNVPEMVEIDNRGYEICRPLFSHSDLPRNFGLKEVQLSDYKGEEFVYAINVHFCFFHLQQTIFWCCLHRQHPVSHLPTHINSGLC